MDVELSDGIWEDMSIENIMYKFKKKRIRNITAEAV